MSVFNKNKINHLTAKMFFDEEGRTNIARYDTVKYPIIKKMAKTQREFIWTPEEVDINKDRSDFEKLSVAEKRIFTLTLARQILLDSVQGRAVAEMLVPITGLPEMENLAITWTFFEEIHSESYTHIIKNIYSNPSEVFDAITDIKEMTECADDISKYYDDFDRHSMLYRLFGEGKHIINGEEVEISLYDLKTKLWLMIMSINILEGLRFYSSFCISWNYSEQKKMEGNAKIIRLICRDENIHLSASQKLLKTILFKDDPDFIKIAEENKEQCEQMYYDTIKQEKDWIKFIFKEGSTLGLNEELLCGYIDWLAKQRMPAVGLDYNGDAPTQNPLPWTASWITSGTTQVAPQETEISSYIVGGINQDVGKDGFNDFKL